MIKFVYFDVGGVAIKDFSKSNKWEEFQNEIGISKTDKPEFIKLYDKHVNEINTSLPIDVFILKHKNKLGVKIPKNYNVLVDGFIKRFEKNKSIWPIISKIQEKSKVGLLTNMYPNMFFEIEKHGLLPKIKWDVVIDSSKVGFGKPNPKIYKLAERKAGVKGSEILFVDNSENVLEAAKKFGWITFLYDSSNYNKSSQKLLKFCNLANI